MLRHKARRCLRETAFVSPGLLLTSAKNKGELERPVGAIP
jgi:hypothetical protein